MPESKLRRLAGVRARCRNPERSEGPAPAQPDAGDWPGEFLSSADGFPRKRHALPGVLGKVLPTNAVAQHDITRPFYAGEVEGVP